MAEREVERVISRQEIVALLGSWVAGETEELAVWTWAQQIKEAREPTADPLVRDIVDILAGLPFDLIVIEDAHVMLDALGNPLDETDLAQNLLWNHLDLVDTDSRRRQLGEHPFYGPFAGGVS